MKHNRSLSNLVCLCVSGFLLAVPRVVVSASASADADFALEPLEAGPPVRLAGFAGKIVVLDFFAHWCKPCARSAPIVEQQIRRHYLERGGNPHGVPVEVVSINVEPGDRERTSAFVRKYGVHLAVQDRDGRTLEAYGGKGLPFFVVLDGTASAPDKPAFRRVYARPGFEGAEKLRGVIDAIRPSKP
ncbi:MAG: TlpA family protein disulfide reductase [Verrucomicrobiales bacterium]|nr:TlpA family protein disulfide reductase [Verrucomicrobiales bacterium]